MDRKLNFRVRRVLKGFLFFAGAAFVFDLGFFAASLLPPPVSSSEVPRVDVIAVLTGGQNRLREALHFLQQGRGHYLFVSGTDPQSQLNDILKANDLSDLPTFLRERILLGSDSRSTVENSLEIRTLVERLHAKSILLVTSNYHLQRAARLLRAELDREPRVQAKVFSYPVESPNFNRSSWWFTFTGWQILLSEYLKSLPYRWLW